MKLEAEISVEVEFDITCDECGSDLWRSTKTEPGTISPYRQTATIRVKPCAMCMENAANEALENAEGANE
jgi:hypothetical protein